MADDKKKKKKKEKKEEAPEPAAPEPEKKSSSKSSSKKAAKKSGSNVFSMFSQKQVAEFKEGFAMMDADKDGVLSKNDLRHTHDIIGRICQEKELDAMLNDAPGPINFTMLISMFADRMSGGTDEDDVVIAAFKAFDEDGFIDTEKLRHSLMTWGDKFKGSECDDAFEQFDIDDRGMCATKSIIELLTASPNQEEEGEGEAAA